MSEWREFTFPIETMDDPEITVEGDRAKVVSDPLRLQILESLGEGKSVAELSEILNVTDARILYHLNRLAQVGVVRLDGDVANSRLRRCLPIARTIRIRLPTLEQDEASDAMPSTIVNKFNQALREVGEGLYGSQVEVSVNHNGARLSRDQASEFSHRLLSLIEDYFPPGKGDDSGVKYGFYGILTPIDLHPLQDRKMEG